MARPPLQPLPSFLLLVAVGGHCLSGCRTEPPPYLHTVYVEALDTSDPTVGRLRVRLVQADGRPAPAPAPRSVIPVAGGRALAQSLSWRPVERGDVSVVVVSDPGLDETGRKAATEITAALEGIAGEVHRFGDGEATGTPMALPGGTRAKAPVRALEAAFTWLEGRPEGGRRVVIASVRGNASGRIWNRQAARALAAGADLLVLAFGRPGRGAPRPRAVHPLFVFPVDPTADLADVTGAVRETVAGGMWAEFATDLPPVEVASGLALRAKLPRGGWEEFALAPVETAPLRVVVDSVRPADPGVCRVGIRVLDPADRPVKLGPGAVAYETAAGRLKATPDAPGQPRAAVIVIDPYLQDGAALRALADAALQGLTDADQAALLIAGPSAQGAPIPALRSAGLVRAEAAALAPGPANAQVDLFAHLEEVDRLLGRAAADQPGGASLIVLSGLHPVRAVEAVGAPSARLGAALTRWRRRGVVPLWAVLSPAAELRRFPLALARIGGVGVAGRQPGTVASRLSAAMSARHADHHATVPCPDGADGVSRRLSVRAAWRGRTATGVFEAASPLEP